ncbi:MAG TPA: hypothetical protein VHV75_10145 [Solirubrobacteraceae bacterium]|nr:hypothetical protein [Solirubrobacteraceae bacterium]
MPLPKARLPRRRGRWVATLALLVAAAVVVIVLSDNGASNNGRSGAGTTATGATSVQRRNLVATDTESGTLSYADSQTVYNRLTGTITWVPQVGRIIKPGHTLFMVDNKPVLLMNGSTPAYRELTAADEAGPDVYELNKNLVALGYDPDGIVVDDTWQAATTAGIDALQYDLGETETGKLTLGQVVFLPGPQMIQTVDTTVGSTGSGSAASYTPAVGSSDTEFVDYSKDSTGTSTDAATGTSTDATTGTSTDTTTAATTTPTASTTSPSTSTTGTTTTPTESGNSSDTHALQQLVQTLRQQTAELKAAIKVAHSQPPSKPKTPSSNTGSKSPSSNTGSTPPSSSSDSNSPSSDSSDDSGGGGSAVAVLGTSSTKLVVTVDLGASVQSEASIGEKVTVEMPDGSTQNGKVTAVSPVAQSSSSNDDGSSPGDSGDGDSGASSTVPVTITLNKPAKGGGLDQASVSVDFVQNKAKDVLSVPVTALLATSGSAFAVQEATSPHKLLPVTTGLFAAGYVEISGSGIYPGLHVTDSQG